MHKVNWFDFLNVNKNPGDMESKKADLLHASSITFDASTLSLTFSATVEYVGNSSDGSFNDDFNLGTTYWIGFESISSVAGGLSAPGTCSNRRIDDSGAYPMWRYPVNPMTLTDDMNPAERMAYPPSDWSLSSEDCNEVVYSRTLSWKDLTSCQDAKGNSVISVTETAETILMEGTFFVELVSPYSMATQSHLRTFQLAQQAFGMAISRRVDVLASTGVQLFISSVIAYGRDADDNYELTILTQSADYVIMSDPNAFSVPDGIVVEKTEGVNAGCLSASSFTCGQIFTATIPAVCPDGDSPTVDLSGDYEFSFTPTCRVDEDGDADEACTVFMSTLPESSKTVVLDVSSAFQDACASLIFEMQLTGNLIFYSDATFSDSAAVTDISAPFVIGQDTIYGKVTVNIPDDLSGDYQFLSVAIENIYVCTADPAVDLTANLDSTTGLGGCLSSGDIVDAGGPYKVYGDGAVEDYQGTTAYGTVVTANNEAAFSFLTFDTPRATIAVHVHLLLTLEEGAAGNRRRVRRRMLLQESGSTGNAFRSYIGTVEVTTQAQTADVSDPVGTNDAAAFAVGLLPAMLMLIGWVMG